MQANSDYNDEIDLKELFSIFWRGKYFIMLLTTIALILGSIYLRTLTPKYGVSVLLAPVQEEQSSTNFGSLGNLASMAGISLPSSSASDFSKYELMLFTREIATIIFKEENIVKKIFSEEWLSLIHI